MLYFNFREGCFTFRFEQVDSGELRVWFSFDDLGEAGPILLDKVEQEELGRLLDRATALFVAASQRSGIPTARPSEPRKEQPAKPAAKRVSTPGHTAAKSKAPSLQRPRTRRRGPN